MDQLIEVLFIGKQNQRRFPDLYGEENVVMLGQNGELEDGKEFLREMAGAVPLGLFPVRPKHQLYINWMANPNPKPLGG